MDVKLRVLSVGVLFFTGGMLMAQKRGDSATKTRDIEEVVVLGTYGIKESQEQKVGSYSLITSEALEKPNALSIDMALAGQAAGTVINANSGQPGSNAKVIIRGISSLTGDNQPLYIIDGVPVLVGDNAGIATTSNALAMIDPADIDTVEILKDGATTSIYGSRGAAGVIVIKTKSGRGGRGKLSFAAEYGLGTPSFEKFDFLNAEQQVSTLINGYIGRGSTPASAASTVESLLHWDGVTNTDWESATRRGAAGISKYNMNYSFGNDKIKGYASIGNTEQEGITRDASYKRANAMVKINAKVNDKINIAVSNIVARATQFGPLDYGYFANPILSSRFTSPTNAIYNADGSYNLDMYTATGNNFNPVAIQDINQRKSVFTKIISSAGLDYNIIDAVRFSTNLGLDYNSYDENEYRNPDFGDGYDVDPSLAGLAIQSNFTYTTVNWSNFLHYDFDINDDHHISASVGSEATIKKSKYPYMASQGFNSGHYEQNNVSWGTTPLVTDSYTTSSHLIGYIGRLSYGYKQIFNIMGSFRRDGYSHFGDNSKYGNFWAGGFNINLDKIGNIANTFSELKLRGSYGEVGNTGGIDYRTKPTLSQVTYMNESGFVINNPGNPDLHWEVAKKTNVGIDVSIMDNRLRASFDYYYHLIDEQLSTSMPNTPSTGFAELTGNVLKSNSRGFEGTIVYEAVKNENFSWTLNGNYSYTRSKVLGLTGDYLAETYFKRFAVGHDPTEWFLAHYAGVDSSNGDALWYTDATLSQTSNGDGSSATILSDFTGKKALPTHTASLTNSMTFGKFTFSFLATYAGDFSVYDLWGRYYDADGQDVLINQVTDVLNAWTPENPNATRPQYRPGNTVTKYHSTRYLYKGDYIKLKSAELGFRLKKDDLKIKDISSVYLYVRGVNLFTYAFDKNLRFDPEANSNQPGISTIGGMGIYDQTQPLLRQVMFGAIIDF